MIRRITNRGTIRRQISPSPQNRQSLTSGTPIFRRDILTVWELVVSKSLSNLEVEPEWCSVVVLSSISASETPPAAPAEAPVTSAVETRIASPAEAPITSTPTEPVLDASHSETVQSIESPQLDAVSEKPNRNTSQSRSEPKPARLVSSTGPSRWSTALRSRRLRIVVTVASVLVVGGLIALNLKSGPSAAGDGVAEMDLSEFDELGGLDEPHIGKPSAASPRPLISDAESVSPTDRFPRMTSGPRLPPLGLVTHADHEASPGQTTRGLVPASATSTGSQGAVLTGQIEFEAPQRPMESSVGPFRGFGKR